jgi:heptosyltransferase-2/heptosyltransferase-3
MPDTIRGGSSMQLSRELRQGKYDVVVNLDRSRWLRLATQTSRAAAFTSVRPLKPEVRHEAEVYLDAVRDLRIATPLSEPTIVSSALARSRVSELVDCDSSAFVVMHPGGANNPGTTMLDKRWTAENYAELASQMARDGVGVIFSGSGAERELCLSIAARAGLPDRAVIAGQTTLDGLAAILERASLYVGPDTGVTHIAAATGAPTIAIFGPTNPRRYRPLGPFVRVLAPPESWHVSDRDLRRATTIDLPSTKSVTIDEVVVVAREMLSAKATTCES